MYFLVSVWQIRLLLMLSRSLWSPVEEFAQCSKNVKKNSLPTQWRSWSLVLQILVLTSETQLSSSVPLMTGPALYNDLVLKSPGCWRHRPFLSSMERIHPSDTGEPLPLIGLPDDYTFTYFFIAQWLHCECLCYCDQREVSLLVSYILFV